VSTSQSLEQPLKARASGYPIAGSNQVIWLLWLTYGSFYFGRANIGAAVPGLEQELGFDKAQIGFILGSLKLVYGFGQLVNGQLAERFPARWLLAAGLLGSAVLNVVFGFGTALYFLLFVWACNGYCQALGWTPTVRVAANWIPPPWRGRAMGTIGTGYQLCGALSVVVASQAAQQFGWRAALWAPALLMVVAAVIMLVFLREAPPEQGETAAAKRDEASAEGARAPFLRNLKDTLSNPSLWLLAIALALLDASRYGFMDWGLSHLKEVQGSRVDTAGLKLAVLPLGGIAGAYLAGWVTDRHFGGRRAPVICMLLVVLGLLTLMYDWIVRTSLTGTIIVLALIGFVIFGPQVLLVGTAPADLARRGTAAAAAGFVNFMGYMGAFAGDQVTGWVVERHGWQTAVWVWAGWAFGAAASAGLLWNATARGDRRRAEVM
jgi:MFS transporter, OPA family, glycerol-3-phosphate transporter